MTSTAPTAIDLILADEPATIARLEKLLQVTQKDYWNLKDSAQLGPTPPFVPSEYCMSAAAPLPLS